MVATHLLLFSLQKVMIRFVYFDLEGAATCSYDSVTLSSGNLENARLCGNGEKCVGNFPKMEYVSVDNRATMTFRTDGSVQFSGYEAEYKCVGKYCSQNSTDH